ESRAGPGGVVGLCSSPLGAGTPREEQAHPLQDLVDVIEGGTDDGATEGSPHLILGATAAAWEPGGDAGEGGGGNSGSEGDGDGVALELRGAIVDIEAERDRLVGEIARLRGQQSSSLAHLVRLQQEQFRVRQRQVLTLADILESFGQTVQAAGPLPSIERTLLSRISIDVLVTLRQLLEYLSATSPTTSVALLGTATGSHGGGSQGMAVGRLDQPVTPGALPLSSRTPASTMAPLAHTAWLPNDVRRSTGSNAGRVGEGGGGSGGSSEPGSLMPPVSAQASSGGRATTFATTATTTMMGAEVGSLLSEPLRSRADLTEEVINAALQALPSLTMAAAAISGDDGFGSPWANNHPRGGSSQAGAGPSLGCTAETIASLRLGPPPARNGEKPRKGG
ncbi:unnamed protein product, partial [Discosporangium mesarthrocarpum]